MGDAGPSSKELGALVAEGGTAGADEVTFAIKWSGKEYTVRGSVRSYCKVISTASPRMLASIAKLLSWAMHTPN